MKTTKRNIIPPIESEAGFWFVLAVVGWLTAGGLALAIWVSA